MLNKSAWFGIFKVALQTQTESILVANEDECVSVDWKLRSGVGIWINLGSIAAIGTAAASSRPKGREI